MTSKNELRQMLGHANDEINSLARKQLEERGANHRRQSELGVEVGIEKQARRNAERERDAFKKENAHLAEALEHSGKHVNRLATFLEDVLTIEPQLKHLETNGLLDFERVHRAAEALRDEDALASVGYTDQCVELPDNVTPLFPHDPSHDEGAA